MSLLKRITVPTVGGDLDLHIRCTGSKCETGQFNKDENHDELRVVFSSADAILVCGAWLTVSGPFGP
jgi:hypothetical protein